jgi:hypothetical protein
MCTHILQEQSIVLHIASVGPQLCNDTQTYMNIPTFLRKNGNGKLVPLHATEALEGRRCVAQTLS